MAKIDTYEHVTDRIIAAFESGVKPWQLPWTVNRPPLPLCNNGLAYRGVNVIAL